MVTHLPRLTCVSLLYSSLPKFTTNTVKQIHAQLITNALIKSPTILSKLIHHYCLSLSPHIAHLIYQQHSSHNNNYNYITNDPFLFNTLIRCVHPNNSILLFQNEFSKGLILFDASTFNFVLGACARYPSLPTLWFGRQLHTLLLKNGFFGSNNIWVPTTIIHFYATNRDIKSARKVFDEMPERTVVTWNAMITGYCSLKQGNYKKHALALDALSLFNDMLVDASGVRPTDTTLVCVLSAASQTGMLETGACIHGFVEKTMCDVEDDVFIGTGLVDMYSKCGCFDSALFVFWRMNRRNVLTWTAMTTGLAIHGKGEKALEVLYKMGGCGVKPNEVTFTCLLSACCHAGLVEEGLRLFRDMEREFGVTPRIQHYGCIVDLLGRAGKLKECYDFIVGMPVSPDAVIWRSLLGACKIHGDVVMGEKVGKFLLQLKEHSCAELAPDLSQDYVALSNVYASAERWMDVETVRKKMKTKGVLNIAGFSSVQTANIMAAL